MPYEPSVPSAVVTIPKNVSTADTTSVHVGVEAVVSVACARLSVTIACSTIENKVSTVDLGVVQPPTSTVIDRSLVCSTPCQPLMLTVSLAITC